LLHPVIVIIILLSGLAIAVANLWPSQLIQSFLAPRTVTGRASVIDGDTIKIHGTRIRLFGIDAPESDQPCLIKGRSVHCGQQATTALSDKINNRTVACHRKDIDRYGRIVATCAVAGEDIGAWMVTRGWALAYRDYSTDYVSQEQKASQAKLGMWQGDFERPRDWRRKHTEQIKAGPQPMAMSGRQFIHSRPAAAASNNCMIKGNISSRGHVYHMPGDKYYARTIINPFRGERWFCSEAEAEAAGWRRASR
jgi:endonuclease YncB( thermonuclease family)